MDEAWLPVVGWEGFYEVSNLGRVRSVSRTVETARGPWRYKGKLLRKIMNGNRAYVILRRPEKTYTARISHIVARAFVDGYAPGLEACHEDGNSLDDSARNLRWDTHRGNMGDKARHGTDHYGSRKACSRGHIYTEENTYFRSEGGRACRTCRNMREREKRRNGGEK